MARRIEEKKLTNAQIKKERKKISDSINIDKKNRESLLKEIKEFEPTVKEQREVLAAGKIKIGELNKVIGEIERGSKIYENTISNKRKELKELTAGLVEVKKKADEMIYNAEAEIEKKIQDRAGEIKQLKEEIETLGENINTLTVEKEKLNEDIKDFSNNFITAKKELASIQEQIDEKKTKLGTIQTEILGLTPAKKELALLVENKKGVENNLSAIMDETKLAQAKLDKVEKERKKRTMDLDEREDQLKIKQGNLVQLASQLEAKEKRVMRLGATLQKHFDKQQIPIKVFE